MPGLLGTQSIMVEGNVDEKEVREVVFQRLSTWARSRHQALSDSVRALDRIAQQTPLERAELQQHSKLLGQHCSRLVLEIEAFRRWIVWVRRALTDLLPEPRLDKQECPGLKANESDALQTWISESDVNMWLLDPAFRCLSLVKSCSRAAVIKCLPRKFGFWVNELKVGVWLAGVRASGEPLPDLTALRLQVRMGSTEDGEFCVKNTFLDVTERRTETRRSRSTSRSPRLRRCFEPPTSVVDAAACEKVSTPDVKVLTAAEPSCYSDDATTVSTTPSTPPRRSQKSKGSTTKSLQFGTDISISPCEKPARRPAPCSRIDGDCCQTNPQAKGAATTAWWKQVPDVCPISNFPISLLPYPPFKLQSICAETDTAASPLNVGVCTQLVDGGFLVVQVLAELRFEALGNPLEKLDIQALDQYMKRCRLGNFRLAVALQLMREGSPEARKELESLRDKARHRLACLKQIQRVRLGRHMNR